MLNKIFSFFIIFFVIYILIIFTTPKLAEFIGNKIWINWFNEFVLSFKSTIDNTGKDLPTESGLHKTYYSFVDWSVNFIHYFFDWVNIIKWRIDKFREDLEKKKQKVEDIKKTYDNVKEIINTASWAIQNTRNSVNEIMNTTSWAIQNTKKIINSASWIINNTTDTINGFNNLKENIYNTWITNN